MRQADREKLMTGFRTGNPRILVTTDVLARCVEVPTATLVVNFDQPNYKETYVSRIDYAGRHGRKGLAINFVSQEDAA